MARETKPKAALPITRREEANYALWMADKCESMGLVNLASSYRVLAADCPEGCGCEGCDATDVARAEWMAESARRRKARASRMALAN